MLEKVILGVLQSLSIFTPYVYGNIHFIQTFNIWLSWPVSVGVIYCIRDKIMQWDGRLIVRRFNVTRTSV